MSERGRHTYTVINEWRGGGRAHVGESGDEYVSERREREREYVRESELSAHSHSLILSKESESMSENEVHS